MKYYLVELNQSHWETAIQTIIQAQSSSEAIEKATNMFKNCEVKIMGNGYQP